MVIPRECVCAIYRGGHIIHIELKYFKRPTTLMLRNVNPLPKAEKSTSPHHWSCYVLLDGSTINSNNSKTACPSGTGPGEGYLLVPGIVELPST